MNSSPRLIIVSSLAAVALLAACNKKDAMASNSATDTAATSPSSATPATATASTTAANAVATTPAAADTSAATAGAAQGQTVNLTANDTMKFSANEIHAKPGESITVDFKNVGTLPKTAMGHNFIVLKSAEAVQPFITDSTQAGATDYIPQNHLGDIIAHTKLLGPGESDSVTFKAPDQAGSYPFFCSFPGHYAVGMKGELIVK
jgi:azurin